ncbi:hypothetical protein E2C01_049010 [Portunus trituberculatus]|uniref:Uncharacterized protein n=1 Tax=Portunus trituberculatus TaxID=210409 RepID=A0A5B7GCN5_PORTR|nr:hypothetical protein [Portunus trituberculatus]
MTRSNVPLSLNFNRRMLALQNEEQVLGVTYDSRLTFKFHTKHIPKKPRRQDMVGLTVMFHVQVKQVSHLQLLRQPQWRPLVAMRAIAQTLGELLELIPDMAPVMMFSMPSLT